jgi:hypothetical protein
VRSLLLLFLILPVGAAEGAVCAEVQGPKQEICALCGNYDGFVGGAGQGFERAQTFVVEHTGKLQAVEINSGMKSAVNGTGGVAIFELRPVVAGKPAESPATALMSVQYTEAQLSPFRTWFRFDFGGAAIDVVQGQQLALVLRGTGPWSIEWSAGSVPSPGNLYAGGQQFTKGGAFATWTPHESIQGMVSDYSFRLVTCEAAVPVAPSSWGTLKARYR